jgi:hypothetical protein
MASRKRRAPGASPQAPMQTTYQQDASIPATDQYMNWNDSTMGTDMNAFNDPTLYDYSSSTMPGHNRLERRHRDELGPIGQTKQEPTTCVTAGPVGWISEPDATTVGDGG